MKRIIGFIGLGIMGKPMARNLMKAGFPLVVYNRSRGPVEELVGEGATAALSPREVARLSAVVITMLPDSPEVKDVILGGEGVIQGIHEGSVVVDMSSINPLVTREIAEALERKGAVMLDAPVSGGEPGAIQGTLAIMAGGDEKVFNDCLDIFRAMGKSIVRVGGIGAGGFTKLVNQIIVAVNIAAVGEAFTLGVKAGLDPRLMYEAIRGGLAGSNVLEAKAKKIFERNFSPGFKVRLHHKDLTNALATGKDIGVPLPLARLVDEVVVSLLAEGKGEKDHSVIATYFEEKAGAKIAPHE